MNYLKEAVKFLVLITLLMLCSMCAAVFIFFVWLDTPKKKQKEVAADTQELDELKRVLEGGKRISRVDSYLPVSASEMPGVYEPPSCWVTLEGDGCDDSSVVLTTPEAIKFAWDRFEQESEMQAEEIA